MRNRQNGRETVLIAVNNAENNENGQKRGRFAGFKQRFPCLTPILRLMAAFLAVRNELVGKNNIKNNENGQKLGH